MVLSRRRVGCVMRWSARFREPIVLPEGGKLSTLDDARAYIQQLEDGVSSTAIWQIGMRNLLCAAEEGSEPWIAFARVTVELAIANPHLLSDKPAKRSRVERMSPEKMKRHRT